MSEKNQKFRELANKRVGNALKHLRLIGNLANRTNYEYDEAEVALIFGELEKGLKSCKFEFESKKPKTKVTSDLF